MKENSLNPLALIKERKITLLILFFFSLFISFLIENYVNKSSNLMQLGKAKSFEKFEDFNYYIWFSKIYPDYHMGIVLGMTLEELEIERFFEFPNRQVPGKKSTSNYYYYNFGHNKNITVDDMNKTFEKNKKLYISKMSDLFDEFYNSKKEQSGNISFLNNLEFDLFMLEKSIIKIKKIKRVRFLTESKKNEILKEYSKSYDPEKGVDLVENHEKIISNNSNNSINVNEAIKILEKDNKLQISDENQYNIKKKLKLYHPEVIILMVYLIYFGITFLRKY